jgi:DNA-binding CsgD family transcriptional regulator
MSFTQLTTRENEIVALILMEKTTMEISKELGISTKTVESHRKSIYLKTGSKTIVGLVKKAILREKE